jgi:hypothetical protein
MVDNKNMFKWLWIIVVCTLTVVVLSSGVLGAICFQEFANESNDCGGLGTGTYGFSESSPYVYINYSKPVGAVVSSLWKVKYYTTSNVSFISLPDNCWGQNPLQLRMYSNAQDNPGVVFSCFNGSGFETLLAQHNPFGGAQPRVWDTVNKTIDGSWDSGVCYFGSGGQNWSNDGSPMCPQAYIYEEGMSWNILSSALGSGVCYQEQSNVSTLCGGVDDGVYTSSGNYSWADADWDSLTILPISGSGYSYVNYSFPVFPFWVQGVNLQVKSQNESVALVSNVSIPSTCLSNYTLRLRFHGLGGVTPGVRGACQNYSDDSWDTVYELGWSGAPFSPGSALYEEAVFWDLDSFHNVQFVSPSLSQNVSGSLSVSFRVYNSTSVDYVMVDLYNSTDSLLANLYVSSSYGSFLGYIANEFNWSNINSLGLSPGEYRLYAFAVKGSEFVSNYQVINVVSNGVLNLTVRNLTGSLVSFNATLGGVSKSGFGSVLFDVVNGQTYSLFVDPVGYSVVYDNVSISSFGTTYRNVSVLPNNAVNITARLESTGALLNGVNTSVFFAGDGGSVFSRSFNMSTLFTGLTPDSYIVTFTHDGFASRSYRVVVVNRTFQNLDAYFNNGTAVLFSFKSNTGAVLSGVLLRVFTEVNGSLVQIESGYSDVSGRVQLFLEPSTYYSFVASKDGFQSYSFVLNPVLFTSYDVILSPSTGGSVVSPSADVFFTPTAFYRYQTELGSFVITFVSQYNNFLNYAFTITYPGGSANGSGSNAHGQKFSVPFTMSGAVPGSVFVVYYNYTLSNSVFYERSLSYPVVYTMSNRTWVNIKSDINTTTGQDSLTGWFVGERVLLVTFISLVLFGVGWLAFASAGAGLLLAGINILFFINTGFVPKPLYYIVFFFLVLYLISRGSDQ